MKRSRSENLRIISAIQKGDTTILSTENKVVFFLQSRGKYIELASFREYPDLKYWKDMHTIVFYGPTVKGLYFSGEGDQGAIRYEVTSIFIKNLFSNHRFTFHRGGTRSGKTHALLLTMILCLFTGRLSSNRFIESGTISIVRKDLPQARKGVYRDLESILDKLELWTYIVFNKVELTFRVGYRIIEIIGMDDYRKVKSLEREVLYCNELNEWNDQRVFDGLQIRTLRAVYADWNPDNVGHWVKTYLEDSMNVFDDTQVITSIYSDNQFREAWIDKQINIWKRTNPAEYRIHALAQYGQLEGLIFPNWHYINSMPKKYDQLCYGMDLGLAGITSLVEVRIVKDQCLYHCYIRQLLYQSFSTSKLLIEKILKLKLDTSCLIHCDNQPDAIVRALRDSSINKMIRPVYKGKMNGRDYLEHSIDYVRKQQVYVLETSRNIINEQAGYVFKKDLAGNFENKPDPKCTNHGIDAIRYAIYHGTNQAGKFRVIGTINAYQNVMWR